MVKIVFFISLICVGFFSFILGNKFGTSLVKCSSYEVLNYNENNFINQKTKQRNEKEILSESPRELFKIKFLKGCWDEQLLLNDYNELIKEKCNFNFRFQNSTYKKKCKAIFESKPKKIDQNLIITDSTLWWYAKHIFGEKVVILNQIMFSKTNDMIFVSIQIKNETLYLIKSNTLSTDLSLIYYSHRGIKFENVYINRMHHELIHLNYAMYREKMIYLINFIKLKILKNEGKIILFLTNFPLLSCYTQSQVYREYFYKLKEEINDNYPYLIFSEKFNQIDKEFFYYHEDNVHISKIISNIENKENIIPEILSF